MRATGGALRAVALYELAKGVLAIAAGFGLLALASRDIEALGNQLLRQLHLNPASHYPEVFLHALSGATPARVRWLALGAAAYAAVRFAEGYGLWFARRWAEWFAALSGAVYLPLEALQLWRHPGWLHAALLAANLLVVAVMARSLWRPASAENSDEIGR